MFLGSVSQDMKDQPREGDTVDDHGTGSTALCSAWRRRVSNLDKGTSQLRAGHLRPHQAEDPRFLGGTQTSSANPQSAPVDTGSLRAGPLRRADRNRVWG